MKFKSADVSSRRGCLGQSGIISRIDVVPLVSHKIYMYENNREGQKSVLYNIEILVVSHGFNN